MHRTSPTGAWTAIASPLEHMCTELVLPVHGQQSPAHFSTCAQIWIKFVQVHVLPGYAHTTLERGESIPSIRLKGTLYMYSTHAGGLTAVLAPPHHLPHDQTEAVHVNHLVRLKQAGIGDGAAEDLWGHIALGALQNVTIARVGSGG